MQSPLETKIDKIIRPSLEQDGFLLICVNITGKNERPTLQIMAERENGTCVSIEDCTKITHTVSALLDVEDPIHVRYDLEVGSSGIDRPLITLADFERFTGYEIKMEAPGLSEGRKRYRGIIKTVREQIIVIESEAESESGQKETTDVPFSFIQSAKLVITDKLLADQQKRRTGNNG